MRSKLQLKTIIQLSFIFLFLFSFNISANNLKYLGCFKDQNSRDLTGSFTSSSNMTSNLCVKTCRDKGFKFAGTQYANQCFCGNSYGKTGRASNCNMTCSGDKNEKCGGSWANSIYEILGE